MLRALFQDSGIVKAHVCSELACCGTLSQKAQKMKTAGMYYTQKIQNYTRICVVIFAFSALFNVNDYGG